MWQANVEELRDPAEEPEVLPFGSGIPVSARQLFWSVPYNDPERLEDVLRRHADRIAAVLIEPILGSCCGIPATGEFLRSVRELCTRHGAIMVMDEVKTGFRVARGGCQELHGVRADVCTLAKAMANGYPVAAIGGREDLMRLFGHGVVHGGTYTAGAMPLAAAERTLRILRDTDALARVEGYGMRLQEGMARVLGRRGIPHSFAGHPSMGGLFFRETPPRNYRDWKLSDYTLYDSLAQHLIDGGVCCEPDSREPWFICSAHDDSCLRETLAAFETSVDTTLARLSRTGPADLGG
jgi:glutamate-1-semialdehyde 2,1-aminomutase